MKNYIKAMVTFVFLMAAAAVMPNTASAAELTAPQGVHQTAAAKREVKITWEAVPGAETIHYTHNLPSLRCLLL